MNIWRAVHRELAVAWRSLRYDLQQRHTTSVSDASRTDDAATEVLPRVADTDGDFPEYEAYARRPRRVRTALVAASLAAASAAGIYLGVVGGLSALLTDDLSLPSALPGVNRQTDPGATGQGLGYEDSRADAADRPSPAGPEVAPPAGSGQPGQPGQPGEPREPGDSRPIDPSDGAGRPGPTDEWTPPVPTPAPDPTCDCPTATPSPSGSPSPTPTPSPSGSPEPEPSGSATPSKSAHARAS